MRVGRGENKMAANIPSEEEIMAVIRENPFITSRGIAEKLRPEEYNSGAGESYTTLMQGLRGVILPLYREGKIASEKVQCCTFNFKRWVANRGWRTSRCMRMPVVGPMRFERTTSRLSVGRSSQSKLWAQLVKSRINLYHINVTDASRAINLSR